MVWCEFGVNFVRANSIYRRYWTNRTTFKTLQLTEIKRKARKHSKNSIFTIQSHNPKVGGSNPSPETKLNQAVKSHST